MSLARLGRALLTSPTPAPKARIGRATLSGTVLVTPKARIGRASISGTAAVIVTPPDPLTLGPGQAVALTAVLASGGAADTWTWRRISGPAIAMAGTGATRTVTAPSVMPPGASIVLGVTATVGGVTSAEKTVPLTVLPQLSWSISPTGWVGARTVPA